MDRGRSLSEAFYSHPAFVPHLLLRQAGARKFWLCNTALTLASAVVLLICSTADGSLILGERGYGFLEHPGIFGWFLIQLSMPLAVQGALKSAVSAGRCYRRLARTETVIEFHRQLYEPLILFIGLRTRHSRLLFSILFTIGFGSFAWNTYQNIRPSSFAPVDFWDSITFPWGYFGTRIYKFYMDALLLPSVIHIFAGIVWTHTSYLSRLVEQKAIRILPFSSDRSGGMMFLADLILSPAVTALMVSGLAFFGAVFIHKSIGITVGLGLFVAFSILFSFYIVPTALINRVIRKMKSYELSEIYNHQQNYYDALLSNNLHGDKLREAHEHNQYCQDMVKRINLVPKWPHLAKVVSAFSLGLTPALVLSAMSMASQWTRFFLGQS